MIRNLEGEVSCWWSGRDGGDLTKVGTERMRQGPLVSCGDQTDDMTRPTCCLWTPNTSGSEIRLCHVEFCEKSNMMLTVFLKHWFVTVCMGPNPAFTMPIEALAQSFTHRLGLKLSWNSTRPTSRRMREREKDEMNNQRLEEWQMAEREREREKDPKVEMQKDWRTRGWWLRV